MTDRPSHRRRIGRGFVWGLLTLLLAVVPMALLGGGIATVLRPHDCEHTTEMNTWHCFDENAAAAMPGLIALIAAVWVAVWVTLRKVRAVESPPAERAGR